MKRINIVTVFNWYCNLLDTQILTSSEQLILIHLMKIFNRNYWQPTEINTTAICRSCGKDSRTVKSALTKLQNKNLIRTTKQGLFLNVNNEEPEKKENPTAKSNKEKTDTVGNNPYYTPEDIENWLKEKRTQEHQSGFSTIKDILH